MRKFGLAAILTFVDKGATAAMGRVGRRAESLKRSFQGIGRGVRGMAAGMGSIAIGALPVAGAIGLMIKKGADFQQAVANLKAVTLSEYKPALESLAKTLGATTVFSATDATNAMTALARAGLDANQIMGAVEGTLNAAAAEGIEMATAADMVAAQIKAFNIPANEAAAIAGKLALASARTNTNMVQLQEALKMAAPAVKPLKATLADTVALTGALADIGLKGTLGGTGVRAAVSKLLAPTKQSKKAISALGVSYSELRAKMDKSDVIGAFQMITDRLRKLPSLSKRGELAVKIFGLRGVGMAGALDLSDEAMKRFNETLGMLREESGKTAERMRDIRLKTLTGQVTLLKSAFEGLSIEVFGAFSGETAGLVRRVADGIGNIALAMRKLRGEKMDPKSLEALKKVQPVFFEIARGIREGLSDVKKFFVELGGTFRWLGEKIGLTGDGSARSISRIITKVLVLTAALAPVGLAVAGVTRLFAGLAQTAAGAAKVVGHTLALAAKGAGGLLGVVGKRVPKLGAFLGKFGGLLGKAGKLTEQVTAQPVRVVNFHEMGMGGLGGALGPGASGARELDLAGRTAAGTLRNWRASLAASVGKLGRFGTFLNSGAFSLSQHTSTLGKVGGALGKAGLLGAALGAGWALGRLIDKATGASTKISNAALDYEKGIREKALGPIQRLKESFDQTRTSAVELNKLIEMQRKFGSVGIEGKKVEITREFAQRRLLEGFQRLKLTDKEIAIQLQRLAPLLAKLPSAGAPGAAPKPIRPAKDAFVTASGLLPVSAGDVLLDRASLASALVSQLRGGLAGAAGAGALGGGDPGRTSPPSAGRGGELRIEVPVQIDGRQVALAVARVRLDDLERSGANLKPGVRSALLQRGFQEVT
jgi:TP901 family phage tail tape measure protein